MQPADGTDAPVDPTGNRLLLGPMLRYVDDTQATIWVETERACTVTVLDHRAPTFCVRGHHYALVIVDRLRPGTTTEYQVALDGATVWPEPAIGLPPSVIRTTSPDADVSVLVGSCRAAAPHEPPYTLELADDERGRGVDSLWAHAQRMVGEPPEHWPTLLLLVGDQIYADDSSPDTQQRIEGRREPDRELPSSVVTTFEEYVWLYREAWSPRLERWLFSVIPSMMIFDDHDMIDDWNISASWLDEIRREPWWHEHSIGGLVSYWIHQHLGNLSPQQIEREGLLAAVSSEPDGTAAITAWAEKVDRTATIAPGHRFSFSRTIGPVHVVMIDCRCARVLEPGGRRMVNERDWEWVRHEVLGDHHHVVIAASLPVFLSSGLHDLQVWSERVCDGRWGHRMAALGERLRRALDLEDWPSFQQSFDAFVALIDDACAADDPPDTIVVASGDIHFSYAAALPFGRGTTRVHQVVSSPIRNALIPHERSAMRATLTRTGSLVGRALRRLSGARPSAVPIEMTAGPFFANNMCELHYRGRDVELIIEHSTADNESGGRLDEVARIAL